MIDEIEWIEWVERSERVERIERAEDSPNWISHAPVWISHWLKFHQFVGETGFPKTFIVPVANPNVPWPGRYGKDKMKA